MSGQLDLFARPAPPPAPPAVAPIVADPDPAPDLIIARRKSRDFNPSE
jgi:hypothetical protein